MNPVRSNPMNSSGAARPAMTLVRLAAIALLLSALTTVAAQSLAALLPSETIAAVGVRGLADHQAKLQPFVDEWGRLGLTEALEDSADEDIDELGALAGVGFFDLLGDEAWLAVSASNFNPLPAVTVVARVSDAGARALADMLADAASNDDSAQSFTEGGISFTLFDSDEDFPAAVALSGNFAALSTNPDTLRGVLRRYQGASEPNFTDSVAYASALAPLGPFTVAFTLDYPRVADALAPLAQGMGFDQSVARVAKALRTAGAYAGASLLTDGGIESTSLQVLGDRNLDPALYDLLSASAPFPAAILRFVPAGAVAVQAGNPDIAGWWGYLSSLAADLQEIGIGDLDSFLAENLGIDMQAMLFSWMGKGGGAISLTAPSAAAPGVTPDSLLGDSVYLVEAKDEAAAAAGISQFLSMAGAMASSFVDPMGEGGFVEPATRQVAGVTVSTYDFGDGLAFETAVAGGYLLIGTKSGGLDSVLVSNASGGTGMATGLLASLQQPVPAGARSMSLSDMRASIEALADEMVSQLGTVAGLTGGADLDFDAVEASSQAIAEYIHFIAQKVGGSYSYQNVDGGAVRGYGLTQIAW